MDHVLGKNKTALSSLLIMFMGHLLLTGWYTAVHSDYQAIMDLDLDNTVAILDTSATNCIDFAEKVTTIMVDCSNALDNSHYDLKVINISNS